MINLEAKTIQIGDSSHPIVTFEVWFRIPTGLTSKIDLAIAKCVELEMDPRVCIIAIPVAVASDSIYEELPR